jgi:hypothetical protein
MYVRTAVPSAASQPSSTRERPTGALEASRLRRWIGLPLLVSYSALLALGALVPEVRPGFLDAPHELATRLLEVAGIRSGHVLMESNYPGDYRFQAYCMIVRGEGSDGESHFLFPGDGQCPRTGLRPRLPPMERALYRFLRAAWWQEILAEQGDAAGILRGRARRTLSRIGQHYCAREEMQALPDPRISLVWYAYEVSYETGDLRHWNFLQFGWLCESGQLVRESWLPSDVELLSFWGSPPWD